MIKNDVLDVMECVAMVAIGLSAYMLIAFLGGE